MQLRLSHELNYTYDRPVFLEPTIVRLRPRHDHIQQPLHHELLVTPQPAGSTEIRDVHDNGTQMLWFDGTHDRLTIHVETVVDMLPHQPFDYLIHGRQAVRLPVEYPPAQIPALAVYRQRRDTDGGIDAFVEEVRRRSGTQTQDFLRDLVIAVPNRCRQIHREDGDPWPATRTLDQRQGSCRDLSVLFMEVCRAVGLAARFVSGYCTAGTVGTVNELHAWAEVYLPGAGWRGYDPTIGVATEDQHIALAAAADPANAAPTTGSYRGTDAQSHFTHHVAITNQPAGNTTRNGA